MYFNMEADLWSIKWKRLGTAHQMHSFMQPRDEQGFPKEVEVCVIHGNEGQADGDENTEVDSTKFYQMQKERS